MSRDETDSILAKTLVQRLDERPNSHWLMWLLRLIILATVIWNQPDGLIAFLTALNWSFWSIFLIVAIYGNLQLVYYFNFTRWITKEVAKFALKKAVASDEFKKDLGFAEKIIIKLRLSGVFGRANRDYIIERFYEFLEKNRRKIDLVINGSLFSVFCLACTPLSGTRSLPAIGFGSVNLKKGLYAVIAGNTVRIFYMVQIWSFLKGLLGIYFKWAIVAFFALSLALMIRGYISYGKLGKKIVEKFLLLNSCLDRKISRMNEKKTV